MSDSIPHTSILLDEFLAFYEGREIKAFFDGTLGAGGHAIALLQAHPEIRYFVGIDRDPSALEIAKKRLAAYEDKTLLFHAPFSEFPKILKTLEFQEVDGIFLDLGVSSMQLDQGERGFSFQKDAPLDMRMDPKIKVSAKDLIRKASKEELSKIFWEFGEERQSRKAADAIVDGRKKKEITTTLELCEVLKPVMYQGGKKHFATKIFQALRIAVNDELGILERSLEALVKTLSPGGRMGVITFHSLEDRIVKQTFKNLASKYIPGMMGPDSLVKKEPLCQLLTTKPVAPKKEEIKKNPRSRSAKLRFVERI